MKPSPDQPHAVRRVVLPSGKTIEVVYFADGEHVPEGVEVVAPARELHQCPECASGLVYPMAWEEAGDDRWALALRCPNCEWYGESVYDRDSVELLDEELDRGTHALLSDLRQLVHANMEDEVDRFTCALRSGHIWPMDF